jgi:hypothetical protein
MNLRPAMPAFTIQYVVASDNNAVADGGNGYVLSPSPADSHRAWLRDPIDAHRLNNQIAALDVYVLLVD